MSNELLVKVKPGADIDALAKSLGAKVIGRLDKLGLYRLQFDNAAATDAALGTIAKQRRRGCRWITIITSTRRPPRGAACRLRPAGRISLTLNPPGDSGKVVVGLIDMNVQSLGAQLDKFILPPTVRRPVTRRRTTPSLTHGTAMAYTILASDCATIIGRRQFRANPAGGCLWRKRNHDFMVRRAGNSKGRGQRRERFELESRRRQ